MVDLLARLILATAAGLIVLGVVAWTAGALYYDVARGSRFGWLLVTGWIVAVVTGFALWRPVWQPALLFAFLFVVFLCWWFSLRPSHARHWHPLTAQLARVTFAGDTATDATVTVDNVRNAHYEAVGLVEPRYERRSYRLANLQAADVLICFWGSSWMCHPIFVFDFGDDGRLCISAEVRYRHGQRYNFARSLYRQQELIFLVSDERDAILRRTRYAEGQDVYLYRLLFSPEDVREAFAEFAESINDVYATPRWYHGLTSNCTTSIDALRTQRGARLGPAAAGQRQPRPAFLRTGPARSVAPV
ncbi:MAG: DUF4105 domain-containing protein [Pirellulales bacterium]